MNAALSCLACAACAFPLLATAGEVTCRGVPSSEYAYAVNARLERTHDPDVIQLVYDREFTRQFKSTYSFQDFYASLTGVQRRLQIGAGSSRDLASRTLSRPEVVENWGSSTKGKAGLVGERAGPGDQVAVEFFTSSSVGKIRQRMQVTCTDEGWKASGVWYLPSGSK
jgi:hypothetical protein